MDQFVSAAEPAIEIHRPQPDAAVVVLTGEHDLASAADVGHALGQEIGSCSHLIVDLSSAAFIDSSTIAELVSAKKRADHVGCRFNVVLASTPIVERALEISGVLPFLNRVKTVERALAN